MSALEVFTWFILRLLVDRSYWLTGGDEFSAKTVVECVVRSSSYAGSNLT